MPRSLKLRLSAMMFLQYFVIGLWFVTLPTYLMAPPHEGGLHLTGWHVGWLYSTMAIAATISPFLSGLLADRLFPAQRVMAVLNLVGAIGLLSVFIYAEVRHSELKVQLHRMASQVPLTSTPLLQLGGKYWLDDWLQARENERTGEYASWDRIRMTFDGRSIPGYERRVIDRYVERTERARLSALVGTMVVDEMELESKLAELLASPRLRTEAARAFLPLFGLLLAYAFCYLPTFTLTNVIALRKLPNPERDFVRVRVLGTIGWMVAGVLVGVLAPRISVAPLAVASGFQLLLAGYCLTLPYTAPNRHPRSLGDTLGLPAIKMLAQPGFRVFVFTCIALTVCISFHNLYLNRYLIDRNIGGAAAWQSVGQVTEIGCMLAIPTIAGRIGIRRLLLLGLIANVLRYASYAWSGTAGLLAIGIPLHGVCYSFFWISAALVVDRSAPRDLRASAQGLVTLLTSGIGAFAGNALAGYVFDASHHESSVSWAIVWTVPAVGSLAAALVFAAKFREPSPAVEKTTGG